MSRHRLYNLGTSACLGLNLTDATQPLGLFECDTPLRTVFWRCNGASLYGASQMKLVVMGRLVVASRKSYHAWRRLGTEAEGPCSVPYEDVHTLLGNGQGMPCAFPFKYNNRWYSECTSEGREDNHPWCATTPRYDQDERWGFCPILDSSCETFWESNQELQACYQFNLYTIVTWSQARASCRAQRGDLLSITSLAEHQYIRERLADVGVMVWIGLNHLTEGRGWQWSDGAPLALVNFTTGVSASPLQDNRPCGVYNSAGAWQSLTCESALPYICKKTPNISRRAEPLENWQYHHTVCPDGWTPHNGFCHLVLPVEKAGSWEESSWACLSLGAQLSSLHSLSHVEQLISLLDDCNPKVWIGLKTETSHAVFWSDGSPVTLTQWAQYQPPQNLSRHGPLCGRADRKGWSRHGNACYLVVTEHLQNFHHASNGYYCMEDLLTIENRFEQAFVNSLLSEMGANSSRDYWVALTDSDKSGEFRWTLNNETKWPLTYSNWNKHQPVSVGGCVVMSGGAALGQWEVKDCVTHKALSVCKHSIPGGHAVALPSVRNYYHYHVNSTAPCPPGWESQLGFWHCFKVFHDEKVLMKRSWVEADFFCQALGAKLAAFHHHEEQVFVKRLLSTMFEGTEGRWFWVGLNKRDPYSDGSWAWSDNSPIVTQFFEDKNEEDEQRSCAVYSHLTNAMLPQPCDAQHEWICELPRGQPIFQRRRSKHKKAGLRSTQKTNTFITMLLQGSAVGVWIGQRIDDTDCWTNGRPVGYTNWSPRNSPAVSEPLCTVLSNHHNLHLAGKWYDDKCSETGYGYICQKPQGDQSININMPELAYRNYKVLPGNMSWYQAQQACMDVGSELASITDAYHQAFLTVLVNRLAAPHWIGLYSQDDGQNYHWSDGSDEVYAHWDVSEDEEDFVTGECVYLDVSGGWRRADCERPLPGALCHVPPPSQLYPCHERVYSQRSSQLTPPLLGALRSVPSVNTSDVLSIQSEAENRFVLEQLWSSGFPHQTLWLSMFFNPDTKALAWLDGSPLNFTNWHFHAPERSSLSADSCLSVRVQDGTWHLSACTQRLGFVCKTRPGTKQPHHSHPHYTAAGYLCVYLRKPGHLCICIVWQQDGKIPQTALEYPTNNISGYILCYSFSRHCDPIRTTQVNTKCWWNVHLRAFHVKSF
uniref:Phospholipase A2 receptor 1 n=1 Tax=Gadus morhua TaxID=8049 RepID=A0A8C5A8F1_GADMO